MQTEQIELDTTQKHDLAVLTKQAQELTITNDDQNVQAGEVEKRLSALEAQIEDHCRPAIAQAHDLHKRLMADMKKFLNPVQEARRLLKRKIGDYWEACEKKRIELEKQQDRERREKEKAEKERIQKEIDAAKAAGDKEKVAELKEEKASVYIPPAEEVVGAQQATGVRIQGYRYDVQIVNAALVPREFCEPSEKLLRQFAKEKEGKARIPGVKITATPIVGTVAK